MSHYKTVSVAQSKNLLNLKPASLTNYELLPKAVFFMFFGAKSSIKQTFQPFKPLAQFQAFTKT
jgi:hypothetical protein